MDYGAAIFFTDYSMGPVELGRALEERGFGSLWAPEHSHIPLSRRTPFPQGGVLPKKYYDVMDPFVTLAAAAAATKRLQVATGVCLVVQRDPIQTAKAVASLDQISGGRFLFGIGAGWNAEEMADHGTEFKTRFRVMQERVEAMKAIWTKSKPESQGEFVNFPPMMTRPKPVQKPHPPVIVGGAYPHGARRTIAFGDGWVPHARKLAALTPRPEVHLLLYHGVLAPYARWRRPIVGVRRSAASEEAAARRAARGASRCPRSWAWATLMPRAFGIDGLACPRGGGRLRRIAPVEDPAVVGTILAPLGLLHPADSPGPAPPSAALRASSVPVSGLDSAPAGRVLTAPRSPAQARR